VKNPPKPGGAQAAAKLALGIGAKLAPSTKSSAPSFSTALAPLAFHYREDHADHAAAALGLLYHSTRDARTEKVKKNE
jgi:hypothetical protein